ncbi:NAD(P)/FAD-dependent oxidoreductase [Krasilnikovia sp. MM14-A1004]|uniref:NAD(P)/FAD-dependent oxidoreductase n=1 Tax=Krasilnikovia sp. MM14-A1004 TaxID=3373541 RepID=UPI00399C5D85
MNRIVVVGTGMAGLRAAERLRELAYPGEVVVLGAEETMPYHRPALSKHALTAGLNAADLAVEIPDDLDVIWRLGTPVTRLDTARHVLHLPGGEELGYDGLIIATGVEARRVNGIPSGHPRITTLRTPADVRRLQRALNGNRLPTLVLGTGFVGCELAGSLRHTGREVMVVGRSAYVMRQLGRELSRELTDLHRRNGVELHLGTDVQDVRVGRRSVTVRLADGTRAEFAAVVVATGSVPGVSWLRDSGVPLDNGVVCDPSCHVAGLDDVVAAGDVARWPNLHFDREARRVEHWTNAIGMGRAAAESLLAGRDRARPFTPVPRIWSEQHGVRIQAVGVVHPDDEQIPLHPAVPAGGTITGFVRDGRLTGVVGLDSSAAVLAYGEELGRQDPTPARRAAPARGPRRRLSFQDAVRASGPGR